MSKRSPIINTIISLINSGLGLPAEKIVLSKEMIKEIEIITIKQTITQIVVMGLENAGFDMYITDSLKKVRDRAIYDYVVRENALSSIQNALGKKSIDYIPLKGVVLKDLYPQPWMRTSSDIDILVREDEIEKAVNAINENTSFIQFSKNFHDIHFKHSSVHLELHYNLLDDVQKIDTVLTKAWDYVVFPDQGHFCRFQPEYLVFYIYAHACKHLVRGGGIGIRPLLDMWLLKTKTTYDESIVLSLCKDAGIQKFYEVCNRLLSVWFEYEEGNDITEQFEQLVMSGGVFGSDYTRILSKKRKNKGVMYFFSRLWIKSTRIQGIYPICKKYPILIPFYQMKRWPQLFNKQTQQKVIKEIRQVNEINQSEVALYEKLLHELDL